MRRFLTAVAVALTFLVFAPAAAHAQEGLCTQSVYEDIDGYSVSGDQLDELNTARNALGARGAEVHVVMLQSFPDDITTVDQYEREVVQSECPELFVKHGDATDPKPDLLMLVISKDDTEAGGIIGSNWRRFHSADNFKAVARSDFQSKHYAEGVIAYLDELDSRIANNRPITGGSQGSGGGSNEPETHIPWAKVGLVIMGIVLVLGLVAVVVVIFVKIGRQQRRKARRDELIGRSTGLLTNYMLADDSGSTVSMAQAWIDQLPDTDDADLRARRDQLVAAHERVVELSSEDAKQRLETAGTDEALNDAASQVDDLETAISEATQAKKALDDRHEQLQRMEAAFATLVGTITAALASIRALITTREGEGYVVEDYTRRVDSLEGDFNAAQASKASGALVTADGQAQAVQASLQLLSTEIDNLPKRGSQIKGRVAALQRPFGTAMGLLTEAGEMRRRLEPVYDRSNWGDLPGLIKDAGRTLNTIDTQMTSAGRHANSKDPKDLSAGDNLMAEVERTLSSVTQGLSTAVGREQLLEDLSKTLATKVGQLADRMQGLTDFVDEAPEGYIESDTIRDVRKLARQVEALRRDLQIPKPAYMTINEQLTSLTTEFGQVNQRAADEHAEATRQVRDARRRAQDRLDAAGAYRDYSGGRYGRADALFSDQLILGMTLQQQLDHWDRAYDSADEAYDHGYNNQPVHTSSYGGSDSADWGSSTTDWGGGSDDISSGGSDSADWG